MSRGPKGLSAAKDGSTPPVPGSNDFLVVTVRDHTRTSSWQVQFSRDTTSQELIRALIASLKLPSSQAKRAIPYVLRAVDGAQGHKFTDGERIGDYLSQSPNAYLILLPEVTAG